LINFTLAVQKWMLDNVDVLLDYDGVYGGQCVDVFRFYVRDCLHIIEKMEGVTGAIDIYKNRGTRAIQSKYFDYPEISEVCDLQCGDIIVLKAVTSNSFFGHVCIMYDIDDGILCFQQDGILNLKLIKQKKPQKGAHMHYIQFNDIAGVLRLKESFAELI